jgi:MBOAT, membrane-bound O-acyltransferase family
MILVRLTAVLGVLSTPALAAPLLLAARGRLAASAWSATAVALCVIPLAAPWLLVGQLRPLAVFAVSVAGAVVMLKTVDWLARPRYEDDLPRVWLALSLWPALQIEDVLIRLPASPRRIAPVARRLAAGTISIVLGLAVCAFGQTLVERHRMSLLDAPFKTVEIYLLAGGTNHLMVGLFALAGFQIRDLFRYPVLASSVLDFWSRYNVCIHRWLKRNIFRPVACGGRNPLTGILAVFGFSGLAHEYLILPVAPQAAGWQLAFFMLHAVGAIAAARLGHVFRASLGRPVPRLMAISLTIAFVFATAPVFIQCADALVEFHRDIGAWVLSTFH